MFGTLHSAFIDFSYHLARAQLCSVCVLINGELATYSWGCSFYLPADTKLALCQKRSALYLLQYVKPVVAWAG